MLPLSPSLSVLRVVVTSSCSPPVVDRWSLPSRGSLIETPAADCLLRCSYGLAISSCRCSHARVHSPALTNLCPELLALK
jgi:hypothetical protein